jgi:protein SCO1
MDLSFLPAVNASLNGLATVLLIIGYVQIRRKKIDAHQNTMIVAFVISCLFLFFYLLHKFWRASQGEDINSTFHATGWIKVAYLIVLFTHVVLAMVVPVLAIWLIRLGLRRSDQRHRRLGKIALPIWLYVSVTGVLIYFALYHFNPVP